MQDPIELPDVTFNATGDGTTLQSCPLSSTCDGDTPWCDETVGMCLDSAEVDHWYNFTGMLLRACTVDSDCPDDLACQNSGFCGGSDSDGGDDDSDNEESVTTCAQPAMCSGTSVFTDERGWIFDGQVCTSFIRF
jgi:hypothetical protein